MHAIRSWGSMIQALLFLTMSVSVAEPTTLRAGPARTRLIELYSSEGCSSCPPADAWMSSLRAHPRLWKDFVPVVFHVTYWDYLGWKDPLADKRFTARQRAYAASWGEETVYTPGFALDGAQWRRWGGGTPEVGEAVGVLEVRAAQGRVAVLFTPAARGGGTYSVSIARLGLGLASRVVNGENAGRTLRHDFVAQGLAHAAMREAGGAWRAQLPCPAAAGPRAEREALAVWVTDNEGRPVQATGGFYEANSL